MQLPLAFIVVATVAIVGCPGGAFEDPLAQILVESAHLDDVSLANVGVGIGGGGGEALLVVDDTEGARHEFPSVLQTHDVGLLLDASFLVTFEGEIPFTLPDAQLSARDLVGLYSGPHVGGNPIVGAQWRDVTHATSFARLTIIAWSVGVGVVPFAWEDLTLALVDDPLRFLPPPAPCTFNCVPSDIDDDVRTAPELPRRQP